MQWRVEVATRPGVADTRGRSLPGEIRDALGLAVESARVVKVYTVDGVDQAQIGAVLDKAVLHDPVLHTASRTPLAASMDWDWLLEVGFRPGVTDNEGRTAKASVALVLGFSPEQAKGLAVYTATQYLFKGALSREQVEHIGKDLLANELIECIEVRSRQDGPISEPRVSQVKGRSVGEVAVIPLSTMSDAQMLAFSRENTLALGLEEMQAIRAYYARPEVRAARAKQGLPAEPTDAEVEALAQTWSEHCKHKIFQAKIRYDNRENGRSYEIDSLFKTFIAGSTKAIRAAKGKDDLCLSVFKDNAGVFKFDENVSVCIKVETHNSPSALDPYGGALTGIVGVNRDPMGTGMGANLVCNTDVFCFASPFHEGELPPRLLHPRRVLQGVQKGVEHGGNKSGVPTVNGSIVFDERYLGKPLVYCGTLGTIPAMVNGKPGHEKRALLGDRIVMCGGRIGKDGIHGATFSSEELHEGSPATAVQIGDPITQRKMYDFLMRARDAGLYNAVTDNGAGGLSSSVGEMAQDTGGARLDLARAPLKYDGLRPWEILLSEAQERMILAVPTDKIEAFLGLAAEMDVEATDLGEFTDTGYFHVTHGGKAVAYLEMDFLHDGVPQMELTAVWQRPDIGGQALPKPKDGQGELLLKMLGRLNICSKEFAVRQYDHEVQGGSAVKPMVGVRRDGPSDAGALRPVLGSERGLVVSHGICPKFSDFDAYWMMANAIDEAVRNAVAVGADPDKMVGTDNFCWCDPVQSEKTPDGEYKLAQLVRANEALDHFCRAFGVPCISGKDSMKNDYYGGGKKISIPPTVLYSVVGITPDVKRCATSDLKRPGELIYLLGRTFDETGGSEIAGQLGAAGSHVPQVDAVTALLRYRTLFQAMRKGLVSAAHDLSDGGLAVALAEMCIGGRLGARLDLDEVPATPAALDDLTLLYSESASRLLVTVKPADRQAFEALFAGQDCALVGEVTGDSALTVGRDGKPLFSADVESMARAFKATLAL